MNTSHIKGRNYELQIYEYLIENYKNYDIYEWKNIPFKYIQKYNFADLSNYSDEIKNFCDVGCDIFMIHKNNEDDAIIVQCKNYENKKVCIDDLAGFFHLIALTPKPLKGLIISNTLLSNRIMFKLKSVNIVKFLNILYVEKININDTNIIVPYNYQLEAVEKFKTINKGILQLFCGMGKTFTSILIAEQFNNIVIISPLRSYASQLLKAFSEKLKNHSINLISSDGERNLDEILKNKKDKNIYSATFCSSDVVYKLLNHLDNIILIVDEFHNLSFNNITDKKNILYKILTFEKISKKLFMSATLKIYELLNKNDDEVIEHSVDEYEEIFGKVFYSYNFKLAVHNKYINDYQIIIPDIEKEKNIYEFIYFNMLYHGYKKCLIYCKSISESEKFITEINELNKKTYNFYIFLKLITYKTTNTTRNKILDNFKKDSTKLNFIISVHTLDECIDIPECDSVYITYNVKNSINIIQRISRSLRIHKNKQKSGIFLWCEKYKNLVKIQKIISDYDITLLNKIFIKYNETSEVVKYKINNVIKEIIIDNEVQHQNKITMQDYFIENNCYFNQDYYNFYLLCENNLFGIELDKVIEYLEYKDPKKFYERFKNTYELNKNYIIEKKTKLENRNSKRVIYYITLECFEKICFISKRPKAINVITFFMNLRKTLNIIKN